MPKRLWTRVITRSIPCGYCNVVRSLNIISYIVLWLCWKYSYVYNVMNKNLINFIISWCIDYILMYNIVYIVHDNIFSLTFFSRAFLVSSIIFNERRWFACIQIYILINITPLRVTSIKYLRYFFLNNFHSTLLLVYVICLGMFGVSYQFKTIEYFFSKSHGIKSK